MKWQWFSILIVDDNGVAQLRLNRMNRNQINFQRKCRLEIKRNEASMATGKSNRLQCLQQLHIEIESHLRDEIYLKFAFQLIVPLVTWDNCECERLKSATFDWHLRERKKTISVDFIFNICHRNTDIQRPKFPKFSAFILLFLLNK